jgi:hypothetical protein
MGSEFTLVNEYPDVELIGDDMGDSSPSVSLSLAPARFEKGTLSPFRKLPLR